MCSLKCSFIFALTAFFILTSINASCGKLRLHQWVISYDCCYCTPDQQFQFTLRPPEVAYLNSTVRMRGQFNNCAGGSGGYTSIGLYYESNNNLIGSVKHVDNCSDICFAFDATIDINATKLLLVGIRQGGGGHCSEPFMIHIQGTVWRATPFTCRVILKCVYTIIYVRHLYPFTFCVLTC